MAEKNETSKWIYVRWFVLRLILVLYDILAVNAAHYLAILTRFYVAKEFHSVAAVYIDAYIHYAPYYTIFCLIVFGFFRLYSGIWKYAGFNDLNRIIAASAVCFVGHVAGTLLFVQRMPITFYCIGGALQFCLVAASRFSPRLLLMEKNKVFGSSKGATINAMVVGTGGTGKMVLRELERESTIRPVCALNYRGAGFGSLLDGIPVVNGVGSLRGAIEKYRINFVIIASAGMPQETRSRIKQICKEAEVEVQDYSGFFQGFGSHITLKSLVDYTKGPVELVNHGTRQKYADITQALGDTAGQYMVKSICAKADTLVIELDDHSVVQNDLNVDWVRNQEKETGEEISFF